MRAPEITPFFHESIANNKFSTTSSQDPAQRPKLSATKE